MADMTSIRLFIIVASISVVTARIIPDNQGHHLFAPNAPSPPFDLNQGEVVMKEAILYLTPSQIKAYEASQGYNGNQNQRNQYTEEEIEKVEAEIKRQLQRQNIYAIDQSDNEKLVPKYPKQPPPVVEEPNTETPLEYVPQYQQKWNPIPTQHEEKNYFLPRPEEKNHKVAESYSYIKFYTDHDVHETPKLQTFHPIPHEEKVDPELSKFLEVQRDPIHNKQYKLVPYEYKSYEIPKFEDVKEITKIASLLEKYNKEESTQSQNQQYFVPAFDEEGKYQKEISELKYAPEFEDHKSIADAEKYQIKVEKEHALARAEAILKAPPSVIRKDVVIKRRPLPHHGKDRHHIGQRYYPDTKKDSPLEIPVPKPEKISSLRHSWKH